MKNEQITEILDDLIEKHITYNEAKHKLFVLFNVSGCAFKGTKEEKFNECDKVVGECAYCEHFR